MARAHKCPCRVLQQTRVRIAADTSIQDICFQLLRKDQSATASHHRIVCSITVSKWVQNGRGGIISRLTSPAAEDERLTFLEELAKRVNKPASQEAYVYAQVAVASTKLRKGDIEGAQTDLAQCESILDTFDSVETSVHAAFYRTYGDYYQVSHCCITLSS